MDFIIRPATREDTATIYELIRAMAVFDKREPHEIKVTHDKIVKYGFSEEPLFTILLVEAYDRAIGFALYFFTFTSSLAAPILYLEDIFIEEEFQRKGIGKALFTRLASIAEAKNCCRMEWHAAIWNKSGLAFYKEMGAYVLDSDIVRVRLPEAGLKKLADLVT